MWEILLLELKGGGSVLAVSLLLGAGLPAVFAIGIRALAWGTGVERDFEDPPIHVATPVQRIIGRTVCGVCFALVAIGILTGIAVIMASGFGMELRFDNWIPSFQPKG